MSKLFENRKKHQDCVKDENATLSEVKENNLLPENVSQELSLLILVMTISSTVREKMGIWQKRDFDDQIADIIDSALMTKDKLLELDLAHFDIERALQTRWPEHNLLRYGSTTTGLALKSSDADFYFALPDKEPLDLKIIVNEALRVFEKQPDLFGNFTLKNPPCGLLLNLVHLRTGIDCDVNFHVPYALRQSQLIAYLIHSDRRALNLAIILKIWGSVHGLTSFDKVISSYSVTLLLVFYLQQKGVLPSIALLQKDVEPHIIGDWNVAFNAVQYKTDNKETLYELLGGFFEYYSVLDFDKYVLSPHIGRCIDRLAFDNINELPDELSLYKTNVINNKASPLKIMEVTIQNSFFLTDNAITHTNNTKGFKSLFKSFKKTAKIYNEVSRNNFLEAILLKSFNKPYQMVPEIKTTGDCFQYE